jgi:UDP-GlcNAc3NAcA epimerase
VLTQLALEPGTYILATIHRAENTDDAMRLRAILGALAQAASEMPIVLPLHPRTRAVLARTPDLSAYTAALRVIDPVGYLDMVALEKGARLIATDSGGVQKEAFFHRVPCLTLRDETEWVELVALGWNRVVSPTSVELVEAAIRAALERPRPPEPTGTLYGGGTAGPSIVNVLRAC